MVYAQSRISPRRWDGQHSVGLCDKNGAPNSNLTDIDLISDIDKKKLVN